MATANIAAGPCRSGRPRESGVWQYFPKENKSVCLINKSDGAQCDFSFKHEYN